MVGTDGTIQSGWVDGREGLFSRQCRHERSLWTYEARGRLSTNDGNNKRARRCRDSSTNTYTGKIMNTSKQSLGWMNPVQYRQSQRAATWQLQENDHSLLSCTTTRRCCTTTARICQFVWEGLRRHIELVGVSHLLVEAPDVLQNRHRALLMTRWILWAFTEMYHDYD